MNYDITQKTKREILANDKKVREGSTFHAHAQASADDERGGRFANVQPTSVTGSGPASEYPRQPTTSPFANDPCGIEPPLNYNIDAQQPTGEKFEIEASLASTSVDGSDSDGPTEYGTEAVRSVAANKGKA